MLGHIVAERSHHLLVESDYPSMAVESFHLPVVKLVRAACVSSLKFGLEESLKELVLVFESVVVIMRGYQLVQNIPYFNILVLAHLYRLGVV